MPNRTLICCDSPQQTNSQPAEDYVELWIKQAQDAANDLSIKKAAFSELDTQFKNNTEWEQRLKLYWDALQKTDRLAEDIASEINLFYDQAEELCQNIRWLTRSTKNLIGLLWETHYHTEELQELITALSNDINTVLQNGNIWQAKEDLKKKTTAAMIALEEAIKPMLDALRIVIMLRSSICRNDWDYGLNKSNNEGENGLVGKLDELKKYFNWRPDDGDNLVCELYDRPVYRTITMPLNGDAYYKNTKAQYEKASKEVASTRTKLEDAKKARDLAQSRKTGLDNAIKAAQEARKN
ncbi:hypothetical protein [Spirosoma panaciterrae]|uniref:hypothetical protein n=1 Tax=Spirosoma panaciterrae TaxID=496058 RepID=UPI000361B6D2|nr:hypothetical protein [Spirosoma panaciterrae]